MKDKSPVPGIQAQIIQGLTASLEPAKPLPSVPVLVAGFVSAYLALALALVAMTDQMGLKVMNVTQIGCVTVALLVGAVLIGMLLVWQMIPGSLRLISTSWAVVCASISVVSVMALLFPWRISPAFLSEGWPCTVMGLEIAAGAAVLFALAVRRGAVTSLAVSGATVGGFSGLAAVSVLQFQCPHQQAPHLLLWHLGGLVLATALGAVIGRIFA
jgi:hypothetical protein